MRDFERMQPLEEQKVTSSGIALTPRSRLGTSISPKAQAGFERRNKRMVSNKTLFRSQSKLALSSEFISYAEDETRQTLGQIASTQYSLEDLVTRSRFSTPDEYKKALCEVEQNARDPSALRSLARISAMTAQDLEIAYQTDSTRGLTSDQVEVNRQEYGSNSVRKRSQRSWWKLALEDLRSPLILFLFVGFVVSLAFQEWAEAIGIILLIVLNTISSSALQDSAAKSLEALATMACPQCDLIREGKVVTVLASEIVVGDVVLLVSGMAVPADIRLIEISDLLVNESLLTGESQYIQKVTDVQIIENAVDTGFPLNLSYHSTLVTGGSGRGICFAVGMQTQMGLIAEKLLEEPSGGSKRTPLETALDKLGGFIGISVVVILGIILLIAYLTNYQDPSRPNQNRFLQLVVLAVGFAVSAMPESLPTVVTTCYAMGCQTLNKQNAKVRRLPAVETLGCTSIICTDKTGTLTQARMVADALTLYMSKSISRYRFYPLKGFDPAGGIVLEKDLFGCTKMEELEKRLRRNSLRERSFIIVGFDNSFEKRSNKPRKMSEIPHRRGSHHTSLIVTDFLRTDTCENILDYGDPRFEAPHSKAVRLVMLIARLATAQTDVKWASETNEWVVRGNATDAALVVGAAKARWSTLTGHINPFHFYQPHEGLSVPFNSSRKIQYSVFTSTEGGHILGLRLESAVVAFAAVKGAPEKIIERSKYGISPINDMEFQVDSEPLTITELSQILEANVSDSKQSMRVLGLGLCLIDESFKDALSMCETSNGRLKLFLNAPLIFLGLISSRDPPKEQVPQSIKECQTAQVRVVIITGDQVDTAVGLAKHISMENAEATTCEIIDRASWTSAEAWEEAVDEATKRYSIFCRARPEDKLTIVQSLQRQGHVVAMTGDGVNDAPALQMADIGVAMGVTGTDVAKGAADLILMDDNFATIVTAIREGRRVFLSCQRFISYLIGTDFGEILYLTIAIVAGLKLPLDALQVLYVNLICDAPPAISLAKEPPDDNVMKKYPRDKLQPILTREYWVYGILPHLVHVVLVVVLADILFAYAMTGVITSRAVLDQCLTIDDRRYYCQTSQYRLSSGWVTSIDYFRQGKLVQYMGVLPGKFTNTWLTPREVGIDPMSLGCSSQDDLGWCTSPLNPTSALHVNSRASRVASTMTFILAAFSEILWPYSIRSWQPFYVVFNRSPWLHIGASVPACLTVIITVLPYIRDVMGLQPLDYIHMVIPLLLAVSVNLLDEAIPKAAHAWTHDY